jgi:hypothetical protein
MWENCHELCGKTCDGNDQYGDPINSGPCILGVGHDGDHTSGTVNWYNPEADGCIKVAGEYIGLGEYQKETKAMRKNNNEVAQSVNSAVPKGTG